MAGRIGSEPPIPPSSSSGSGDNPQTDAAMQTAIQLYQSLWSMLQNGGSLNGLQLTQVAAQISTLETQLKAIQPPDNATSAILNMLNSPLFNGQSLGSLCSTITSGGSDAGNAIVDLMDNESGLLAFANALTTHSSVPSSGDFGMPGGISWFSSMQNAGVNVNYAISTDTTGIATLNQDINAYQEDWNTYQQDLNNGASQSRLDRDRSNLSSDLKTIYNDAISIQQQSPDGYTNNILDLFNAQIPETNGVTLAELVTGETPAGSGETFADFIGTYGNSVTTLLKDYSSWEQPGPG
jgi:hypothetical protein